MLPFHAIVVHFPLVLLLVTGVLYVVGVVRKQDGLLRVGYWMHIAGLVMCVAAILTGDYEESRIVQNADIHELVEQHELLGMVSAWGFGVLGVWAYLRQGSRVLVERVGYVVVYWALLVVLGWAGHVGGRMVFEEGAGVLPMKEHIENERNLIPAGPEGVAP